VVLYIKDSGLAPLVMGLAFRNGQMARSMKANGMTTKRTVLVSFGILMATSMKVTGKMIRHMVREPILT
jgi:hypothetical protein